LPALLVELAAGRVPRNGSINGRLVVLADEHRLTGLLWSWARDHVVDVELKSQLARNDLYVQAHLLRVWSVLEDCVRRLAAEGIEIATIKGVTAEARWYGRPGERPCSDVDLLLAPHQLDRAADALRVLEPDHPWTAFAGRLATTGRIQAVTTHVDGLEVDLHFDLLKLGIPTRQNAEAWSRTIPYPLPHAGNVLVLDDTTALVHLLVHLNKDRFQRLLGFADVARVIAGGRVDWSRLRRFVEEEGIDVPVLCALEVVLDELSLPWPAQLKQPTGPRALSWRRLWPPAIRLRGTEGRRRYRRRQDLLALMARGRGREAIEWWLRDVWPPPEVVAARYRDIRGPYPWKLLRGRARAISTTPSTRPTTEIMPTRRPAEPS
jgi:hypothetical protein